MVEVSDLTLCGLIFVFLSAMKKIVYLLFLCFGSLQAQVCLIPSQTLSNSSSPLSIVSADFNNDGNADLAVAALSAINVYLGNPAGQFQQHTSIPVMVQPGMNQVRALITGDYNQDGKQDLIYLVENYQNARVLLGDGLGGFTAFGGNYPGCIHPLELLSDDFDNDNVPDLLVSNFCSQYFNRYLGTGTGSFVSQYIPFFGSGSCYDVSSGDFNNDGNRDLVQTDFGNNAIALSLGQGTGSFTALSLLPAGTQPKGLCVSDFNTDGNDDLAITLSGADSLLIWIGSGNGTFTLQSKHLLGAEPGKVKAADFNKDGYPDLLVANSGTINNTVSMFLNNNGQFSSALSFTVSGSPTGLAIEDFNKDGFPDFATANKNTNQVSVWLSLHPAISASPQVCAGTALNFQAIGNGIASYTWSNGSQGSSLTLTPTVSGSVSLVVTNSLAGCVSTASLNYLVIPLPNIMISTTSTVICQGESQLIQASGANTYTWYPMISLSPSVTVSPAQTATYTVVATASSGCVNQASLNLQVQACVGVKESIRSMDQALLSPNPSRGLVYLNEAARALKGKLLVLDVLGKCVYHDWIGENSSIDLSHLPKGLYCYTISIEGKQSRTGKLILE